MNHVRRFYEAEGVASRLVGGKLPLLRGASGSDLPVRSVLRETCETGGR